MKVEWKQIDRRIHFAFEPSPDDSLLNQQNIESNKPALAATTCYFDMPEGWNKESVHPDLLATAISFMIDPFTKDTIELPLGVSQQFHDAYFQIRKKRLLPVDPQQSPRETPSNPKAGLCFSGGVDSTAAAMLLPKDSVLVFADRDMDDPNSKGLYNKNAALFACSEMQKLGHTVINVLTNYEYVRSPLGFATNYSSAVPVLLLADHLKLSSVALGMILESAFAIGDNPFNVPSSAWFKILNIVGLPTNLVTAGLSEVSTSKIVASNPDYKHIPQSCVRGDIQKPCMKCMKCLRKTLLEKTFTNSSLDDFKMEKMFSIPKVYETMTSSPLHHENVYVYIYNHYKGSNPTHFLLKKKVFASKRDNTWLAKWFPESESYLPEKEREAIKCNILNTFEAMDTSEVQKLKNWNPKKFRDSFVYRMWNDVFNFYSSKRLKNQ
jgi:hypothetical protein